ncbi:hypothetical protein PG989_001024 [Apiospora arundinis]
MPASRSHTAVAFAGARKPLQAIQVLTEAPKDDEILIQSQFTASTPLDLHRVGPQASGRLRVGDRVFGWAFQEPRYKAHQEYVTAPEWMFGKIPENISSEEAATIPENLITIFNTLPEDYVPDHANDPILVWGAGSSVGQSALQVLRWYGYRHILATASPAHHEYLRGLGATECFDYRDAGVAQKVLAAASRMHEKGGKKSDGAPETIPFIIDCIGSRDGSLGPILQQKLAQRGSIVAVMLPVILTHASPDQTPEYAMDAAEVAGSLGTVASSGVTVKGVRTFFVYDNNPLFKEKLPSEIIPALLAQKIVTPQRYRLVEGKTILEREENALKQMREGAVSGVKLVWRTSN